MELRAFLLLSSLRAEKMPNTKKVMATPKIRPRRKAIQNGLIAYQLLPPPD